MIGRGASKPTTGVALLHFGEPAAPDRDVVVEYLTRIFYTNADLEDADSEEAAMARSRELAERRAPGLIEEYESIGGSPLQAQAESRADTIEAELIDRGYEATVYVGMQFTDPLIDDVAAEMADDGIDRVVGLPMYPLCGPSTTVAALDDLEAAIDAIDGWEPTLTAVSGWHRHPTYSRVRVDAIRSTAEEAGVDLAANDAELVFSAHGTPQQYLKEGSRYVEYVEEYCGAVAEIVGAEGYSIGYQNHENRDVEWTRPDVEDLIASLDVDTVVVDPASFVHEQSETLAELDGDLAEDAAEAGLEFHRVPVPHDDERLPELFVDLLEPWLAGFEPAYHQLRPCQCRDVEGTYCLNAPRE